VAEQSLFTAEEIVFLRALQNQGVAFMVVGAAAAALQGAPIVTQNIDLWFKDLNSPGIKRALGKAGGSLLPSIGLHLPTFAGPGVELFDIVLHMHGLGTFDREMKNTILVKIGRLKVKILALERIIKSKEAARRPKDLLTVPVLKDALATIKKVEALKKRSRRPDELDVS